MRALILLSLLCACAIDAEHDIDYACEPDQGCQACDAHEDCSPDAFCTPPCDAPCFERRCVSRPREAGDFCPMDGPELCPAGTHCIDSGCAPPQPPGSRCGTDADCAGFTEASGPSCAGGRCAADGSGRQASPCTRDRTCGEGLTCRAGACG